MPVSFNPKDQIKGGLITDVDGTLTEVHIDSQFVYPNSNTTTCAVVGKLILDDGEEHLVFWSLGKPEEWEVSADGLQAEHAKGKTGVGDSSNFAFMVRELIPAGYPENKIGDSVAFLEGVKAHWIQKAPPKRAGLENTNAQGQERTCLVTEKILLLPGEKAKGKAKPAASAKPAAAASAPPPAASNGAGDMDNEAAQAIAMDASAVILAAKAGQTLSKSQYGVEILGTCSKLDAYKSADQATKSATQRLLKNVEFATALGVDIAADGSATIPA